MGASTTLLSAVQDVAGWRARVAPALEHACLYIPLVSEDALLEMKQPSYVATEDTFFAELSLAMALMGAKRLVILPLLIGPRAPDDACVACLGPGQEREKEGGWVVCEGQAFVRVGVRDNSDRVLNRACACVCMYVCAEEEEEEGKHLDNISSGAQCGQVQLCQVRGARLFDRERRARRAQCRICASRNPLVLCNPRGPARVLLIGQRGPKRKR